jgi:HAD superfamily hydrolase (TIGR01509 family)
VTVDWLGYAAAVLTDGAVLPQLLKGVKTRSTDDVSWGAVAMNVIGGSMWLSWGLTRDATPLIAGNTVLAGSALALGAVKLLHVVTRPLGAVLWDLDGTLVDSEPLWLLSTEALAEWLGGRITSATLMATVGASVPETVSLVFAGLGRARDAGAEAQAVKWLIADVAERFATGLTWRPGARELLAQLRAAGVPCALVTSMPRATVDRVLTWMGDDADTFAVIVCGDDPGLTPKPSPMPYTRALEALGVARGGALVVEDSMTGCTAGRAAGCSVLLVPSIPLNARAPARVQARASLVGLTPDALRQALVGASFPRALSFVGRLGRVSRRNAASTRAPDLVDASRP